MTASIAPVAALPNVEPIKISSILPATRGELRRLLAQGINRGWQRPFNEIQSDLVRPLPDGFISWFKKKSQ